MPSNLRDLSFNIFIHHLLFAGYYFVMSPYCSDILHGKGGAITAGLVAVILFLEAWAVGKFAPRAIPGGSDTIDFSLGKLFLLISILVVRISLIVIVISIILTTFWPVSVSKILTYVIIIVSLKELISLYRIMKPRMNEGSRGEMLLAMFVILNFGVMFLVGLESLFGGGFGDGRNEAIPDYVLQVLMFCLYFLFYSAINFVHIYPPWQNSIGKWERFNIILSVSLSVLIVLYKILS